MYRGQVHKASSQSIQQTQAIQTGKQHQQGDQQPNGSMQLTCQTS